MRIRNCITANVKPIKVELKKDAKPVAMKGRRYISDGRKFMERYVHRVIEYSFTKITTTAKWIVALVLITKPAPADFHLTFDNRRINASTERFNLPTPHIDTKLSEMSGRTCFAKIDFVSGY